VKVLGGQLRLRKPSILEIIGNAASLPIKLVICVFDEGIRLTASHAVDVDKELGMRAERAAALSGSVSNQ